MGYVNLTKYQGFYANELYRNEQRGQDEVTTALNGDFHNGYTVMNFLNLNEEVQGSNLVLDVVLKGLVQHRKALEEGKRVNVYVEWTLTPEQTEYLSCDLVKIEYEDINE